MAKTKLRWGYPPQQEMHTIEVHDIHNHGLNNHFTHLRPCQYGINEQGEVVKILYCTRDVRFFTHEKDGWHEQLPDTSQARRDRANRKASYGGNFDLSFMRHFGNRGCHRLIAYAWCKHPEEASKDHLWYKRYECDHLNGNHSDSSPENLRWLTPQQNRDWAKRQRAMRKIGLDLRHIPYSLLLCISDLSDFRFDTVLSLVQETFTADTRKLTIDNINFDIRRTLDWIDDHTIHCARCGCEMIEGTEKHSIHYETLCDCCYDELYG